MSEINTLFEIIIYKKKNFVSLGVVSKSSKERICVITEDGKELELDRSKIIFNTRMPCINYGNISDLKLELRKLRKELDEQRLSIDLKTLWDCINDNKNRVKYELKELIDYYMDNSKNYNLLTLFVWSIERDTVYFKKENGFYIPNDKTDVDIKLKQHEAEQIKKQVKANAVDWARKIIDNRLDVNSDDLDTHIYYIELVKGYVVYLDNYEKLKESKSFLSEIGIKDESEALEFLVKLGLWDKNDDPIFKRYGIKSNYPNKIIKETNELLNKELSLDKLIDITKLNVFSIDDDNTVDIDDAISIESLGEQTRLGIHISNVASIINDSSALDNDALKRGETIYLSEGNIHMFPQQLVSNLLTLKEKNIRRALSLFIIFDRDHNILSHEFLQTKINLKKNYSYKEANKFITNTDEGKMLVSITKSLRERRVNNGAIILQLPVLKIIRDESNNIVINKLLMNTDAHNVVAECMVLMNSLCADYFRNNEIPSIYRSQIDIISEDINELDKNNDLFPVEVVKYLKPTNIGINPEPHRFLGLERYVQITSPIRRYLDLVLQRQLISCLDGSGPVYSTGDLEKKYLKTELAIKEKKIIEKSREKYWLLRYFKEKELEQITGVISSIRNKRASAYFPDYLIELPFNIISDDQMEIGNGIDFYIEDIDLFKRKMSIKPVIN